MFSFGDGHCAIAFDYADGAKGNDLIKDEAWQEYERLVQDRLPDCRQCFKNRVTVTFIGIVQTSKEGYGHLNWSKSRILVVQVKHPTAVERSSASAKN